MVNNPNNFVLQNSPDGGFLQSKEWRKFQENTGKKTYSISEGGFYASIVEHKLPLVGSYWYIPRGPIFNLQFSNHKESTIFNEQIKKLAELAINNNAGWIRIEPASDKFLNAIKENIEYKIVKAPHDMQPKEIFLVDIAGSEEQLLAKMKSKTRYNIRLAEKHGVRINAISKPDSSSKTGITRYVDEFIRLTKIMAKRQGIQVHPEEYYRKMIKTIPGDILKLYVAEYKNKIIAANLVAFYGNTCTYLHGASDDSFKNIMAPYALQWKQIQDAKNEGCKRYDFGGVKIINKIGKSWEGVTRFKTGFSPDTKPIEFPGSYDIIIIPIRHWAYRIIQKIKNII